MVKNPPANAGDTRDAGSIHGLERFPRVGNGNLLQYSSLENSMDFRLQSMGVTKSWTHTHTHTLAIEHGENIIPQGVKIKLYL